MKLIVLKDNFKKGLSALEHIVIDNNNLPILKNVLIKTHNNKVKISATNLEVGIDKLVSGKIIEEGSLTVPFNTFYNIISNADSERINIKIEKNNLLVKTDNYQAKIQGIIENEFPIIPKISNNLNFIEINSDLFKNSILDVISAAQISEIRPEISGILFDFQNTFLKLVATDSFRLAEKTILNNQFKTNINNGFKAIVPLKTIQEVVRIFPGDGDITIHLDQNQILFKNSEQELISRLIDGQFPDYEQIIPKNIETEIILNNEKFIKAIRLVSALSGKVNEIKLKIKENSKALEIYSANQHLGENSYLIPAKIKGPDFRELNFNWRYLTDGIKAVKTENIFLGVNGDVKPAVIRSPEEGSYIYI